MARTSERDCYHGRGQEATWLPVPRLPALPTQAVSKHTMTFPLPLSHITATACSSHSHSSQTSLRLREHKRHWEADGDTRPTRRTGLTPGLGQKDTGRHGTDHPLAAGACPHPTHCPLPHTLPQCCLLFRLSLIAISSPPFTTLAPHTHSPRWELQTESMDRC